jgi:hypothetical protein
LAAKWGYATFLEVDGDKTIGHFRLVDPLASPSAELRLGFGEDSYAANVEVDFDGGGAVRASRIPSLSEPKFCYDLLFAATSQALREVALSKLGGEVAALGVLHTWSRQLIFHPHIHYNVPGGFLSENRLRWIRLQNPNYLLPENVLGRRVRTLFLTALRSRPDLPTVGAGPACWVVNTQPVGSGEKALGYLAAYVQRTALSSQRIVKEDNGKTTFKYRASDTGRWKLLTLDTPEFLRRFLQHVLPTGFHRVRYFGWWSPAAKEKWARILALLDWREPPRPPKRAPWAMTCRCCGQPMRRLGLLLPCRPP